MKKLKGNGYIVDLYLNSISSVYKKQQVIHFPEQIMDFMGRKRTSINC